METKKNFLLGEEGELLFIQQNGRCKKICNGSIVLEEKMELFNVDGSLCGERIKIVITSNGKKRGTFSKTCQSLNIYFSSADFRQDLIRNGLIFSPEINHPERYVAMYALEILEKMSSHNCYVLEQGLSEVQGNRYYVFGERIISENSNAEIQVEARQTLELRNVVANRVCLPEKNFLDTVLHFLEIDEQICPLLLAYSCFSVLQDFFLRAGISSRFVLVLEGQTGELKSSAARILTDIFMEKAFLSFGSSLRAIQNDLAAMAIAPVLIDDVNKSSFRETTNRRGVALTELIQAYSERAIVSKMQGTKEVNLEINSGLIVTAEEMPPNPSTINRCVIAHLSAKLDKQKLKRVQEQARVGNPFAEFYCSFAGYVLHNFDNAVYSLKTNFEQIRATGEELFFCDPEEVAGFSRILSSYALLIATITVFGNYLLDKGLESKTAYNIEEKMKEAAKNACFETMKRVMSKNTKHMILDALFDLYAQTWEPQHRIASSLREYCNNTFYNVGYKTDDVLYIQGKILQKELNENKDSMIRGKRISLKEISEELRRFSLLKVSADGKCSHHVPGNYTKKRFYAISIRELERIEDEFFQKDFGDYMDEMIVQIRRDDH